MKTPTLEPLDSRVTAPRRTLRDHRIARREAAALVRRYREQAPADALFASMFGRSIFDAILAQEGCVGIRCHYAREEDGSPTLVLVGVNAREADMWSGVLAENHWPCPPWCPPGGFDAAVTVPTTNVVPHIDTPHDHIITRQEARELIARYREGLSDEAIKSSMFDRSIFDEILAQPRCTAIRLHYAMEEDGSPTLVLVGVDEKNADMWNGVLGENHWPCPPWCPPGGFDD